MDDSQQRTRRVAPRPFFTPRSPIDRATPSESESAARVTPARGKPRLFTPPASSPAVPGSRSGGATARPGDAHALGGSSSPALEKRPLVSLPGSAGRGSAPRDIAATRTDGGGGGSGQRTPTASSELDDLKEIEPWAMPEGEASPGIPGDLVAAALERVAGRIRAGEVELPPDSTVPSDEAAVALALAALSRSAAS